jgi:hypothetical protein
MTEYQFHWWPSGAKRARTSSVSVQAESRLHGAALALRDFRQLGCDIAAPLAHIDVIAPDEVKHTLLVEEVLHWLADPEQADFIRREDLAVLLH